MEIEFILYVTNQEKSRDFYAHLLGKVPCLDVPGMTEFELKAGVKLGLMPNNGIAKILLDKTPHPEKGTGIPRCEIYLKVENATDYFERGKQIGANEISPLQNRDWGDKVGYLGDLDGHVIAFAERIGGLADWRIGGLHKIKSDFRFLDSGLYLNQQSFHMRISESVWNIS